MWDVGIGMWDVGTTVNMVIVVAATMRIVIEAKEWQWVFGAAIGCSVFCWWMWVHLLAEGMMISPIANMATPEIGGQTKILPACSPFWLAAVLAVSFFVLCYLAFAVRIPSGLPPFSLFFSLPACGSLYPSLFLACIHYLCRPTKHFTPPNHSRSCANWNI